MKNCLEPASAKGREIAHAGQRQKTVPNLHAQFQNGIQFSIVATSLNGTSSESGGPCRLISACREPGEIADWSAGLTYRAVHPSKWPKKIDVSGRSNTPSVAGSVIAASFAWLRPIIGTMARGWESKSVEAQQSEASEKSSKPRIKLTPEAAARSREQENLRLSRQNVVHQLEKTQNPRHRKLLEKTLADLDQKLNRFNS